MMPGIFHAGVSNTNIVSAQAGCHAISICDDCALPLTKRSQLSNHGGCRGTMQLVGSRNSMAL